MERTIAPDQNSLGPPIHAQSADQSMSSTGTSVRDEASTVRRLVHTANQQHVALRALELQLNHSNLQVQALSAREQDLRQQVDILQLAAASSEQDKLLLESKLNDIAGFEGALQGMNCSLSLKDIRGKLLHVANTKISELTRALQTCQHELEESKTTPDQEQRRLALENQALREEVTRIGEQLAQRTVLYSAQERRYHDATRTYGSLNNEKETENIQLRARLQQLEQQYEKSDRAHIEAVLLSRQLEETNKRSLEQLSEASDRIRSLDSEVADLTSQNISLQATVERLRGADVEDLERDLMIEVEIIRAESKIREEALRRQLDNAQDMLSSEAGRREQLVDEVESLRMELTEQSNILREANSQGLIRLPAGLTATSSSYAIRPEVVSVREDFDALASTELDASLILNVSPEVSKKQNGESNSRSVLDKSADNSIFAAMFGTLDGAGLASDSSWGGREDEENMENDEEGRVQTGAHRYRDQSDYSEDELDHQVNTSKLRRRGQNQKMRNLDLPLVAASSLQTIKTLLVDWCSATSNLAKPPVPLTSIAPSKGDKRLTAVIMELSKNEIKECQSPDLWKEAKELMIDSIRVQNVHEVAQDTSVLWDNVTSLMVQILALLSEKRAEWTFQSQTTALKPLSVAAVSSSSLRESHQSSCLSKNFLTGAAHSEDGGTAESSFMSNSTGNAPTTIEGLLKEELASLKEELILRNRREVKLRAAYKEQGAKLAIVLKRAADLSVPLPLRTSSQDLDTSIVSMEAQSKQDQKRIEEQQDFIARLQGEMNILRQQLDSFREELSCSEKQSESSRQLGFAEAAELYSASMRSLEAELTQVKASLAASAQRTPTATASVVATEESCQTEGEEGEEEQLQLLRGQVRTLKQALLDNFKELESLQLAFRGQLNGAPDSVSSIGSSKRTAFVAIDTETQTVDIEMTESVESVLSESFTSALSHANAELHPVNEEAHRLMEETVRSHLELWDARADSWTLEQAAILKKLEEAQQSLAQLSAKHETEKREALLELRRSMEDDHGEALASLRVHHREEVISLIARLQKEHGEAMTAATQAMQLQLHKLIASLTQDHQEELQRVSLAAEMSMSSARDASTTAEASTLTDLDVVTTGPTSSPSPLFASPPEQVITLELNHRSKLEELERRLKAEMIDSLSKLETDLTTIRNQERSEFEASRQERELQHEEEKQALVAKYRARLKQQKSDFLAERKQLMALVHQEYAETCSLVEEKVRSSMDMDRSLGDHESCESSFVIYPEMLSPETTSDLFRAAGMMNNKNWVGDSNQNQLSMSLESDGWTRLDASFIIDRATSKMSGVGGLRDGLQAGKYLSAAGTTALVGGNGGVRGGVKRQSNVLPVKKKDRTVSSRPFR